MYEGLINLDRDVAMMLKGQDPALCHRGDFRRPLLYHQRQVDREILGLNPALPPVGPLLMGRVADARVLYCSRLDLLRRGGEAPGPNGLRLQDLSENESSALCGALSESIRGGTYRPGPARYCNVPKEGKAGTRTITIQNVEDRIVGRATTLILMPLADPRFSAFSFGFRPRTNSQIALASALALMEQTGHRVCVRADVAKAFDRVPLIRVLDACRRFYPPEVIEFVRVIAATGTGRGVRQGSPASPFFFNLFADQFLDGPWRRRHPGQPLLRYADDLFVVSGSADEAMVLYSELSQLATSAGTPLGKSAEDGIRNLAAGETVPWLGYQIKSDGERLRVGLGAKAWARLELRLAKAHLVPFSPLIATALLRGWINYIGPCFETEDRRAVVHRARAMATAMAFDEVPSEQTLAEWCGASHARWCELRKREAKMLPCRLANHHTPSGQIAPAPEHEPDASLCETDTVSAMP